MTSATLPRSAGGTRRLRLATLLAAPLLTVPLVAAMATGTDASTPPADAQPATVTLITGDVVTFDDRDGEPTFSVDAATRADGPALTFVTEGDGENFYVYPSDVAEFVFDGLLDRELFNVPGLIRQGLDDASAPGGLPVIVTFADDRGAAELSRAADALPMTSDPVAVEAINGAGVTVDRAGAERFRAAVLDAATRDGSADDVGAAQRLGADVGAAQRLGADVDRIALDRVLTVSLDRSVPQIGAPGVWDAGHTGEGITVAVLDTGIDAGHPDLAGRVAAAEDFTGENGTGDPHGHGTHVASTIAGSGAASDGRYVGVAPGASLISGKVCDTNGECPTSVVMAGMEWAAEQADIVNMSLGSDVPSDGTDVMSQLLDDLTAATGTLFVTAAGNSGPSTGTVGSPGAADSALAVGAVDSSDLLAAFSSRGLRVGDFAVKPDVTAPGVGIVAARAGGTEPAEPVGDHYAAASGTSMAAPHVAGAAALLAQARPDLTAAGLKDALASTAVDGGYRSWEQGTGRVDVARAVGQGLYASASLGLGDLDSTDTPVTDEIIYTNMTDADVTLHLHADVTDESGRAVDEGFVVSTDEVTVPAGGQARVTVTVDPAVIAGSGLFGGAVTATDEDVRLRTAIGFGRTGVEEPGFSPSSTSWTSSTHGWVLGWVPCGDAVCAEVRETTDGGQHWSVVNAPQIHPSEFGEQTRIFFAEQGRRIVGLITDGRELYASYDGAATWQREDLGVERIGAIDATDQAIYLTGFTSDDSTVTTQVFRTPIAKGPWIPVRGLRATGPGSAVSTGSDVAAEERTVQVATATFGGINQVWTSMNPGRFAEANPCDEFSATHVGVVDADQQFVLCSTNPGRGAMDKYLMSTTDGVSFSPVSMAPRTGITTDFAVADASTVAIGATGGDMGIVFVSFDGGVTWEATLAEPDTGPVLDLDFQDSTHGTLVTGYPTLGTSTVFRTVDGGRTWARMTFAP